jgi:hypothetical protein
MVDSGALSLQFTEEVWEATKLSVRIADLWTAVRTQHFCKLAINIYE